MAKGVCCHVDTCVYNHDCNCEAKEITVCNCNTVSYIFCLIHSDKIRI